ncbi:hypothetical protein D915_007120 [Fasciola hepatica]|uniref:Uncharacterized protein n=1 Tax=Fasciola hepatica TaxID=6192 RepID=A0A4E0R1N9_FASHE|nr:hypothetical protein D915_007120 [Fasciola hepatica]
MESCSTRYSSLFGLRLALTLFCCIDWTLATRSRLQTSYARQIIGPNPYWLGTNTDRGKRRPESSADIIIQPDYEEEYSQIAWPIHENEGHDFDDADHLDNVANDGVDSDEEMTRAPLIKRYGTVLNDADSKALEARGWRPQRYG